MDKAFTGYLESEIGFIEIVGTQSGILSLAFTEARPADDAYLPTCVKACAAQLQEYFKGDRKVFSVNLLLQGTDFQKKVWKQLMKIPFGETASYKDIAASIGRGKAARAVGNANGRNKIPIIIPCHRVIAADGSLAGFGSGIWRKEWLLNHEKIVALKDTA
jgi:methylated-DNA-[protein]-cysteine S-methyltransferase